MVTSASVGTTQPNKIYNKVIRRKKKMSFKKMAKLYAMNEAAKRKVSDEDLKYADLDRKQRRELPVVNKDGRNSMRNNYPAVGSKENYVKFVMDLTQWQGDKSYRNRIFKAAGIDYSPLGSKEEENRKNIKKYNEELKDLAKKAYDNMTGRTQYASAENLAKTVSKILAELKRGDYKNLPSSLRKLVNDE